ncbi:MAG: cell division protein ZapA [Desulfobulbaceae bacterium]|nr:MAG: cell division protein ZapA [Desulfobulbaceae bacterium]
MERVVKFEVLGQEYPLYTDAPEEDVQEILGLVKSQLEGQGHRSSLPVNKVAILASLNMAGKYVRLKRDFEEYRSKIQESVDRIQYNIDQAL